MPSKNNQKLLKEKSKIFEIEKVFVVVLILWVLMIFIQLIIFWIESFYSDINLLEVWSFRKVDPPWVPPGSPQAVPLFFGHFFGDFQLSVLYSKISDPYMTGLQIPWSQPPISIFILFPFSLLPLKYGYIVYLFASLLTFVYAIQKISSKLNHLIRIFLFATSIISLPLFVALDRGNFVLLTQSVVALFIYEILKLEKNSKPINWKIALYLTFSLSMKPYVAALLVPLFLLKNIKLIKQLTFSLFFFLASNLFVSFMFPGGPTHLVREIISGIFGPTNTSGVSGGVSMNYLFYEIGRTMLDSEKITNFFTSYSFLPGLAWFIFVNCIALNSKIAIELKLIFVLSLLQFAAPVSVAYTMTWASIALALLFNNKFTEDNSLPREHPQGSRVSNLHFYLISSACFVNLGAWPIQYWRCLSPTIWLVVAFFVSIVYFFSKTKGARLH
jgi:hypothetical protein